MQDTLVLRQAQVSELPMIAEHWLAMFEEVGKHRESEFTADWRERFTAYFTREIAAGNAAYYVAADGEHSIATAGALLTTGYPAAIRLHASPFGRPIYEKLGFAPTNEMQLHGYRKS